MTGLRTKILGLSYLLEMRNLMLLLSLFGTFLSFYVTIFGDDCFAVKAVWDGIVGGLNSLVGEFLPTFEQVFGSDRTLNPKP